MICGLVLCGLVGAGLAPLAETRYGLSGGAADANVLNERGVPCVNISNGMTDIHTPDERIAVETLTKGIALQIEVVRAFDAIEADEARKKQAD